MANTFFNKIFRTPKVSPKLFLIRTFLLLPALLVLWYLLAPWLNYPALALSKILVPLGLPKLIEDANSQHSILMVNTLLGAQERSGLPVGLSRFSSGFFTGATPFPLLLTLKINSLIYSYGLPVLVALTLATPAKLLAKLSTLLLGYLLVTCIIIWGLYFNTASSLLVLTPNTLTEQAKTLWPLLNEPYIQTFIAFGYRIGFLIFPVVLPIMLWAQLNPQLLQQLIHGTTTSSKSG